MTISIKNLQQKRKQQHYRHIYIFFSSIMMMMMIMIITHSKIPLDLQSISIKKVPLLQYTNASFKHVRIFAPFIDKKNLNFLIIIIIKHSLYTVNYAIQRHDKVLLLYSRCLVTKYILKRTSLVIIMVLASIFIFPHFHCFVSNSLLLKVL